MMTCDEAGPLLGAYFDSELDLATVLSVERHLEKCSTCSADLRNLERLHEELSPAIFNRIRPPERERLGESVRKLTVVRETRKPNRTQSALWVAVAAALVLAVVLPVRRIDSGLDRELVDSHVRSLMASHLVDVPSSDQHTVKPWFQGKIDFAPDVPDLSSKGYELIGGRLDILGGHPTAALVYKHNGHYVNLWTSRTDAGETSTQFSIVDGYRVARWINGGLSRSVVTDMNPTELQKFVALFQGR